MLKSQINLNNSTSILLFSYTFVKKINNSFVTLKVIKKIPWIRANFSRQSWEMGQSLFATYFNALFKMVLFPFCFFRDITNQSENVKCISFCKIESNLITC